MHAQTFAGDADGPGRAPGRARLGPGASGTLEYGEAPAHAARWAALLAAHGVRRGDRVALMAGNRIEFLSVVLGCGWLGAVAVPINTASRGMQLRHILENSACVLLVADAASCAGLATVDGDGLALREIWLLDGDAPPAGLALPAPAGGARRAARRRRTGRPGAGRHAGHPVHLRHIRPVQGRVLSACAILVVGPDRRAQPGDPRRGRALHQPAAVPHQCVERLFPGAGDRRVHRLRRAFLGQPILRPASRPAPR